MTLKALIARHQVVLFFVMTFVVSWFPWYTGLSPEALAIGPSLAAFSIVLLTNGKAGLVDLLRGFARWRAGLVWWGIAVFGSAALFLAGVGVYRALGGEGPAFTMLREELHLVPLYLFLVVLMPWQGPVGEEFGWRGYALSRLQATRGPLMASLILGAIWGLWHLPTFFAPTGVLATMVEAVGMVFILPYTATTIANSIFMTWIYNKTRSPLIAGIVAHASINFWAPVILSNSSLATARDGGAPPTIAPDLYLWVTVILVGAALALVIATKGKLGLSERSG